MFGLTQRHLSVPALSTILATMSTDEVPLYWQRRNREALQAGHAVPNPVVDGSTVASADEDGGGRTRGPASALRQTSGEANDELIVVDDNNQNSTCIDLTDDTATVIDLTSVATNVDNTVLIYEAQAPRPAMQRLSSRKVPRAAAPVDSDEDVEVIATSQSAHGRLEGSPRSSKSRSDAKTDSTSQLPPSVNAVSSQSTTSTTVICPICLDDAHQIRTEGRQLSSTVCGHVFCDPCIRNAAKTTRMCPTCRRKLTVKSIHPLYL